MPLRCSNYLTSDAKLFSIRILSVRPESAYSAFCPWSLIGKPDFSNCAKRLNGNVFSRSNGSRFRLLNEQLIGRQAPLSVLIPVKIKRRTCRDCIAGVSSPRKSSVVDPRAAMAHKQSPKEQDPELVQFIWNGNLSTEENWALENIPWQRESVLIVDADERITPELECEIRQAIRRTDVDGFYLNRRFWFLGGWINHCGYFPSWNLRLFRHRLGRYEQINTSDSARSGDNEVHEHVLLDGRYQLFIRPDGALRLPDIAPSVEKHNRYSRWEAAASRKLHQTRQTALRATPFGAAIQRKAWLKKLALKAPFRPCVQFFIALSSGSRVFITGYRQ